MQKRKRIEELMILGDLNLPRRDYILNKRTAEPRQSGILFNTHYTMEEYDESLDFSTTKIYYYLIQWDTVSCITGTGLFERQSVETYIQGCYIFEHKKDRDELFNYLKFKSRDKDDHKVMPS